MFIRLNFLNTLNSKTTERIIKISRIKEVRDKSFYSSKGLVERAEVLLDKDKRFKTVTESVDEIFGIIQPRKQ